MQAIVWRCGKICVPLHTQTADSRIRMNVRGEPQAERGVAQSGSAPGLGPGGRRFESCRPDTQCRRLSAHTGWKPFCVYSDLQERAWDGNSLPLWCAMCRLARLGEGPKKRRPAGTRVRRQTASVVLSFLWADPYSGRLIASWGHTLAHVPHSVQRSGLIEYFSPSEIASTGHSPIHVPQAMQSSPITYAIIKILLKCY